MLVYPPLRVLPSPSSGSPARPGLRDPFVSAFTVTWKSKAAKETDTVCHIKPIWERWLAGPPDTPGAWTGLGTRQRGAWLDLVRERGCRLQHQDRPAGHTYELDGQRITDEPGLYLALGEALNGPGGYFGGCLDALVDCLRGNFGYTAPVTLLWRESATARKHLSQLLTPDGEPYNLVATVLEVLAEGGMRVTLA